jgi:DNA-directed RNA polymerase subunit beta'
VLQYFISTHGARKGLADTALKTANSGYLTRRLVDVAQDAVITENDCGTLDGIESRSSRRAARSSSLGDRILGRTALEDVVDPLTGEVLVRGGEEIDEAKVRRIEDAGIEEVTIRSVLTCQTRRGICALCYGRDLARGYMVNIGEAVGIIAAQSIGEPGTQLTMRTFHIGGAAARGKIGVALTNRFEGRVKLDKVKTITPARTAPVVMNRHGELVIVDETGRERERHHLVYGADAQGEGRRRSRSAKLAEWDPFAIPILTEVAGTVKYGDLIDGVTMEEKVDEVTGLSRKVVIESRDLRAPAREIKDPTTGKLRKTENGDRGALLPPGRRQHRERRPRKWMRGRRSIAKIPRETTKTKDITGGLPRVAELFEARKPKDHAIVAEIDGTVTFGKDTKGKRKVLVTPEPARELGSPEYLIPKGKAPDRAADGDFVRAGEPLMDGPPTRTTSCA